MVAQGLFLGCGNSSCQCLHHLHKVLAVKTGEKPMSHRAFRRRLIESLSEPIRSSVIPRARSGPWMAQNIERLRPVWHFPQMGEKRRDCVVCSDRQRGVTRHLTLYVCGTCYEKSSLCPAGCFEAYHTQAIPPLTLAYVEDSLTYVHQFISLYSCCTTPHLSCIDTMVIILTHCGGVVACPLSFLDVRWSWSNIDIHSSLLTE